MGGGVGRGVADAVTGGVAVRRGGRAASRVVRVEQAQVVAHLMRDGPPVVVRREGPHPSESQPVDDHAVLRLTDGSRGVRGEEGHVAARAAGAVGVDVHVARRIPGGAEKVAAGVLVPSRVAIALDARGRVA